jgi:hypothetical protein
LSRLGVFLVMVVFRARGRTTAMCTTIVSVLLTLALLIVNAGGAACCTT